MKARNAASFCGDAVCVRASRTAETGMVTVHLYERRKNQHFIETPRQGNGSLF
jgi:hypothetical protein